MWLCYKGIQSDTLPEVQLYSLTHNNMMINKVKGE